MKMYMLKTYLTVIALVMAVASMQAQFDDVYYDPDAYVPAVKQHYDDQAPVDEYATSEDGVTYYDDDTYGYYDDYDYYYSSRIKRFYHPYTGFGFYDPVYVGYNYYDPFAWDYYTYPGANIYFSFGLGFSFGFGSYWSTPAPYYYSYNNWYYPSYTYWGGCGGYYPYGNYYNPYYPPYYGGGSCGGGYYGGGGGYYPGHGDHHGGHDDYYYGPRVTGNTGSSPRGPVTNPGIVQPDVKAHDTDVTQANDRPRGLPEPGTPGRVTTPETPVITQPEHTPAIPAAPRQDANSGVVRQVPVDREIPRDQATPAPKRPVFRPDVEKYQPYPTPERAKPAGNPAAENPSGRPTTPPKDDFKPYPGGTRTDAPARTDQRPSYTPPSPNSQDRPSYSPPPRQNSDSGNQTRPQGNDRPSYSPPPRPSNESRSNDRPSYSPPPRSNDSQRSNDRPSYSPSSGSGSSSGSHSPSSGGGSSSRSSGSSGGSSNQQSSSPRGRG